MSLWSRQQAAPVAVASAVGLLFAATAVRSLFHSPSPRILKAPEPSEEAPYKYSLYEGGSVLQTPYGKLRYYELGPEDGKRVLLIHGISTPCPVWQRLIPKLVESGHRVLCYDLVGRGYSDGPADIQYNESVYISQLCFLLTALPAWSGSFNIIGYSMGGTIATKFASYFPERVDKLLLISPAGFIKSQDLPWYENSIRIGYLHIKLARSLLSNGIVTSHFLNLTDLLKWQSKNHKGFIHSFTSSLTNDMIWDLQPLYQSIQKKFGDRMQIIWGDQDVTCPLRDADSLISVKTHIIKGGRHDMIAQQPFSDEIAQLTIDFFSSTLISL